MKTCYAKPVYILVGLLLVKCHFAFAASRDASDFVVLPSPRLDGPISLEKSIEERRSIRSYSDDPVSLAEVSQLVWSAQGVTSSEGFRTAPSAGATYPLEVYILAGNVEGLSEGLYKYSSAGHSLTRLVNQDLRDQLCRAALNQQSIKTAPVIIIFSATIERTARRYGERARRYVYMEAGHSAQNVLLQAASLGLGAVVIGAFDDREVASVLNMSKAQEPLYLVPVGKQNLPHSF